MCYTATICQTFIQSTRHTAHDSPTGHLRESVPLLLQRLTHSANVVGGLWHWRYVSLSCSRRVQWEKGLDSLLAIMAFDIRCAGVGEHWRFVHGEQGHWCPENINPHDEQTGRQRVSVCCPGSTVQ